MCLGSGFRLGSSAVALQGEDKRFKWLDRLAALPTMPVEITNTFVMKTPAPILCSHGAVTILRKTAIN